MNVDIVSAINESVKDIMKLQLSRANNFIAKNPILTATAASMALHAYNKNKRNTIRLFAKDPYEKRMMTDIVNTLTKQGKFKLQKTAYADGGQSWILKKV